MLVKVYILVLISLSFQTLLKAEVLRNKFVSDEDTIDQKFEDLEKEIGKLKTENRYLRLKLERIEQKTVKLEEHIKNVNQTNIELDFGKFLTEAAQFRNNKTDFKADLLTCLIQKLGIDQAVVNSKGTTIKTSELSNKRTKDYDEHFNCIRHCEKVDNLPKTCAEALAKSHAGDGIYQIYDSKSNLKPFYVYCLQDAYSDNDWLVIQRRQEGNANFARNWTDYLQGFGNLNDDYWLGLERLHALTSARKHELWIQMKDNSGMGRYASYSEFGIGNETENFKLVTLGNYTGDAGDSLGFNYNAQFSTYDRDNDEDEESNCAEKRMSGWWFKDCKHSLNGLYNSTDYGTGINWIGWHDYRYSLSYVHIAIRPVPVDLLPKTPMVVKPVWIES